MALVLADRVQETTSTAGTGAITLAGAVSGFQSFAVVGNGNTCYYTILNGSAWEVGIGTYSSVGPSLARTTVLSNSSGNTSPITLSGASSVFLTYPAERSVNLDASGNVSPLGTISSGVWQGSTVGVAYGGTGVTASSGANSVVLRDTNQNINFNNYVAGFTATTASAGTTVLTVSSTRNQILVGSTTHTFQMPNATTLQLGQSFLFVNNSSGVLTITNNASAVIETIPSGGVTQLGATNISTSAGTFGIYSFLPGSYDFSNTAATFNGATISNAVWNGTAIAGNYGGTGLTTFVAANNAIYSTGATTLTAGTLPVAAGGTGVTSLAVGYIPYGNGSSYASSASLQFSSGVLVVGGASALGGATNPITAFTGNTNNYIQTYVYNQSNGISASSDFVAYANNSTDAHGWADMGFTSSTYADTVYTVTGPNEAYVFGSAFNSSFTGNLVYATDSTGSANAHQWYVGGFTQLKSAWKMQLTSTGLQLANALGTAYGGTGNTSGQAASVANSHTAGTGLNGSTFNGSAAVTWTLATSGVTAATYTNSTVAVDTYGRITSASSGTAPVTSVAVTAPITTSGGTTTPTLALGTGYGDTQNPYASKTANYFLAAPNGAAGAPTFRAIVAADIPTLNQNTSGTASNVTGIVALINGGSGQSNAQSAMNAFAGAVTSKYYLRGDGSNVVMAALSASDLTNVVAIANGGTNSTATPTAGGIGYGTGTAHAYTAVGTSGNALISAGASAPAFGALAIGTANVNISGALTPTNGGTGVATLSGLAYGNGTSAFTAATAAQVVGVIGTTAVANATTATNQSGGTVSATTGAFSGNVTVTGTGSVTLANSGDITASRSGGTTGVIYFGASNSGTKYLYFDGTNYAMPGGQLDVNGSRVLNAGNYQGYSTFSGLVTASQSGFQSATYSTGRNRIWSFGNADTFGINYWQGSGGYGGADSIGFNFGTTTANTAQFSFNGTSGNLVITGAYTGSGSGLTGTAASLTAGTATNQSGGTVSATTGSFSGLLTGRDPGYVTSITSLGGSSGAFTSQTTVVPNGGTSFTPILHGATVLNSTGYVGHVSFGCLRTGTANWAGGAYLGLGGNDNYTTEYYTFGYGGTLAHSSGQISVSGNFNVSGNYIANNIFVNNQGDSTSTSAGVLTLWSSGPSTTSAILFKNASGSGFGEFGTSGGYNTYFVMDTPGRGWVFRSAVGGTNFSGTNVASITNQGNALFSGTVTASNLTSGSTTVTVSGSGSGFSAVTYNNNTLYWMRSGNRCFWKLYLNISGVSGGSGTFLIQGFPYNAIVDNFEYGPTCYADVGSTTTMGLAFPRYINGQSYITLTRPKEPFTPVSVASITCANVVSASGAVLILQGDYQVA